MSEQPKVNKKKLENLERIRRKKEAKISKNKAKKLAQIAERKRIKQTVRNKITCSITYTYLKFVA